VLFNALVGFLKVNDNIQYLFYRRVPLSGNIDRCSWKLIEVGSQL
jgi:hypothetical protein